MGLGAIPTTFFRSYLSQRQQFTVIGDSSSSLNNINCGVPQGSVLGPILFLVYINDLSRCTNNCRIRMFADDTCMDIHDVDIDSLLINAERETSKIFDWCLSNKLTINSTKTCFIIFHGIKKYVPNDLNSINVGEIKISRVKTAPYLGLLFDECLTWKDHVSHVCKSLLKYFGIFNHIKHIINKKLARQIYFSFIYSRIKYGLEIYGSCSNNLLNKVQIIQNKLLKMLLRLEIRTSTNELHKTLKLLKVQDIYNVNILNFVNNCINGNCPDPYKTYFVTRESGYNIRGMGLQVNNGKTNIGASAVKIYGAKLWNNLDHEIKRNSHKKCFKKYLVSHFINYYDY